MVDVQMPTACERTRHLKKIDPDTNVVEPNGNKDSNNEIHKE